MMEEMQYDEKGNVNPGFVDYRVPTSADIPRIESVIVEVPAPNGPYGAKGVGETFAHADISHVRERRYRCYRCADYRPAD